MTTSRSELALVGEQSPAVPVGELTLVDLKTEAVHLKLSIDQGENVMRAWRIRLGEVLAEIKERVGHGNWLPYIEENISIGRHQAANYMRLAENGERVLHLPAGLSMREELAALREPRPIPEHNGVATVADVDGEASRMPLLRYCPPGMATADIVAAILLTSFPEAKDVMDATYGSGNFWNNSAHVPLVAAHDLDPTRAPSGEMDFRVLKYGDASFDVVTFDPPHLADGGEDSVMAGRFGTVASQEQLENLILDGVREVWRVCHLGIIVKVTNHVHGRVFVNEVDLVAEALGWNQPVYDQVHQVRTHAFVDPKWGDQRSAYNNGSTYLVYKKDSQIH
jgi:hypothetical protein